MHFTINKEIFNAALKNASYKYNREISSERISEVFKTFALSAYNNKLYIAVNHSEYGVVAECECTTISNGCAVVYDTAIQKVVNSFDANDTITLELIASEYCNKLQLSGTGVQFKLQCCDNEQVKEFKTELLSNTKYDCKNIFDAQELLATLKSVVGAISTNPDRYHLNMLYLETSKESGKLVLVASDGHRLLYNEATPINKINVLPEKTSHIFLHRVQANHIVKVLDSQIKAAKKKPVNCTLYFCTTTNSIELRVGNLLYVSKTSNVEYPNYKAIMRDNNSTCVLNTKQTIKALKLLNAVYKKNGIKGACIKTDNEGCLQVSCINQYGDTSNQRLEYNGNAKDIHVSINPDFLMDAIKSIKSTEFTLELQSNNSTSPINIYCASSETFKTVIMPMRIN